ncbi:MAG: putative assembly protein [Syntrophorhabdus sp. PtaU1.Bin153]|nr:MAG: putative assembly protein [Syntrophorhabdus sp. PtaU1.Bin153]
MRAEGKKILIIAGSVIGVMALIMTAAITVLLSFDINSFKPAIETAASEKTGLDVKIRGRMGFSFFPLVNVSAKDIHATGKGGGEFLFLEQVKVRVELIPLLKKQIKVTSCEVVKPALNIVKDAEGKFNFETKSTRGRRGTPFSLGEFKLSRGMLVYLDKKTGEKTELKEINLTLKDLSVSGPSGEIIKNVSFTGTMECRELQRKNITIQNINAPVKAVRGIYSFQTLDMKSLVYLDKKTGEKTELKEINLTLKDLSVSGPSGEIIKNVSFTGTMECRELQRKNIRIYNVKGSTRADKGVFYVKPFTMDIFGGIGEGDATADRSKTDVEYKINLKVSKLDLGTLQESFGIKMLISGKGDLAASLTIKEKSDRNLINTTSGVLSLVGNNLVTHYVDLDKILSAYETSQKFSLVDIGVFFIAGPLGSIALKGYHYGDLYYQTQGGRGTITKFVSQWKIKNGVAEATDCALATRHNRVALKGKLNLVSQRYDNVIVALLDDKGCAKFRQSVSGPFAAPQIGAISAVESFTSQIFDLYRQVKRLVQGGKCEVFYNGSVQQPE